MTRQVLVAVMALLAGFLPRSGAAQELAEVTVAPSAPSTVAPTAPASWARATVIPLTRPAWLPTDSSQFEQRRRLILGARVVGATVASVLLSVDDDGQWRRCATAYPDPYPGFDRALSRKFYDGLCLRRWEHHAARMFIAHTTNDVARRLFGMRRTPAALVTSVGVGVAPHVISRLSRIRGPKTTAGDAAADMWFASMPLALSLPKRVGGRWTGMALWTGGYALLYPFARP